MVQEQIWIPGDRTIPIHDEFCAISSCSMSDKLFFLLAGNALSYCIKRVMFV